MIGDVIRRRKIEDFMGKSDIREVADFKVPAIVREIADVLGKRGKAVYLVGGSVRDLLCGNTPADWDVATSATPKEVISAFRRVIPTGVDHGTVTVMMGTEGVEVTTLRGEGAYSDGRHPDTVVFLDDIRADLARRDFTINAIAWEPTTGILHDPFRGREDIEARIIRAVGVPAERFAEDSLRVMRAARFAATLEMDIDPATAEAIPEAAAGLVRVSAERKRDELLKILMAKTPSRGLSVLGTAGIVGHAIPSLAKTLADSRRWGRLLRRVDGTGAEVHLRLASFLMDADAEPAEALGAMKLDRKTCRLALKLAEVTPLASEGRWTARDARLLLSRLGPEMAEGAVEITRAHLLAGDLQAEPMDSLRQEIDSALAAGVPIAARDLAVGGNDLVGELGLSPGPEVGRLIDRLLRHVLDDPSSNRRDHLMELARKLIGS